MRLPAASVKGLRLSGANAAVRAIGDQGSVDLVDLARESGVLPEVAARQSTA